MKAAFDDLLQQISKHKDLLRNSHKWQRRRVADFRPQGQVAFEDTVAAVRVPTASSDDIRTYVNASLARLERFVERELYFRETAVGNHSRCPLQRGGHRRSHCSSTGQRWGKTRKPGARALADRLALRSIHDLSARSPESLLSFHLEDSARRPNVRGSDEPESQFHQPDETLTGENVIADRRAATPEYIASSDEMVALVQFALEGANRPDREALNLGRPSRDFRWTKIGVITDRKPDEVRSSIELARKHLDYLAPLANRFGPKPDRVVRASARG